MKHLLLLLLLCCCHGYGQANDNYIITRMALSQIHEDQYRLLQQPNNTIIMDYLDGFAADDFGEFDNVRFSFVKDYNKQWKSGKIYWGEELNNKIEIISDFDKVQKTQEIKDSKSYIRLSNPAISGDGEYAIINIDFLSNYALPTPDSYLMIFKKKHNEWKFMGKFTSMLY